MTEFNMHTCECGNFVVAPVGYNISNFHYAPFGGVPCTGQWTVELLPTPEDPEIDDYGYKRLDLLTREELLDETLAYMIHNDFHSLECYSDGDGWNEPYSEDWTCGCDVNRDEEDLKHHWDGIGWVQIDPKCSDRPSNDEVYRSWIKHVREEQEYYR